MDSCRHAYGLTERFQQLTRDHAAACRDLLFARIEMARLLIQTAQTTGSPQTAERCLANARRAHDAAAVLYLNIAWSEEDRLHLEKMLVALRRNGVAVGRHSACRRWGMGQQTGRAAPLLNELRLALRFLDLARKAKDEEGRVRNSEDAWTSYVRAAHLLSNAMAYSEQEWLAIEELTSEFRVRLHSAQ